MCYAIPGKVVKLNGRIAVLEYFGETRKALNEMTAVRVGDYVYAQGGILIDKIPEKEAIEILNLWRDRFFELKKSIRTWRGKMKLRSAAAFGKFCKG